MNLTGIPSRGLDEKALSALACIPVMSTSKGYHFGETLGALLTCCGTRDRGFSPTENRWELINKMFKFATNGADGTTTGYSIEMERRLVHLISDGDNEGARQQLNQVLSYISFSANGNLDAARARCMELLVLMSRAAIDAGRGSGQHPLCSTRPISTSCPLLCSGGYGRLAVYGGQRVRILRAGRRRHEAFLRGVQGH